MTTLHFRLVDPILGSVYQTWEVTAREAWHLVARAARLGSCEAWFFSGNRVVMWRPGVGISWGSAP